MRTQAEHNVVWAVDPTIQNARQLAPAQKLLNTWEKFEPIKIYPVSLVTPIELTWPVEYVSSWETKVQDIAEEKIKPILRSLHMKNLSEPSVLVQPTPTMRASIDEFIRIAKKQSAEMIVTTTHRRKGLGRFRLGTFTQTLIERSPMPVLTIRPDSDVPKKFSKILFPTDFSKLSRRCFDRALDIAERFNAKIFLFHNFYGPGLPFSEVPGIYEGQAVVIEYQFENYKKAQTGKAKAWIENAAKRGVKVEFVLGRSHHTLSRAILHFARKEGTDLIAVGIESHPVSRAVLGSAVREVIEASSRPVLVLNGSVRQKEAFH